MNEYNIVNLLDDSIHYRLCRTVLRYANYGEEIDANSPTYRKIRISKKCEDVALLISTESKLTCRIRACICSGRMPEIKERQTKFSVAAIKDDSSVILLKRTDDFIENLRLYNLLEYFENVDFEYLYHYHEY